MFMFPLKILARKGLNGRVEDTSPSHVMQVRVYRALAGLWGGKITIFMLAYVL